MQYDEPKYFKTSDYTKGPHCEITEQVECTLSIFGINKKKCINKIINK